MVKKIPALLIIVFISASVHSQQINLRQINLSLSHKDGNYNSQFQKPEFKLKENSGINSGKLLYKKTDLPTAAYIIGIVAFISPMVVFEDKKVFFALTKEVSLGKYPFGRLSFEYSYVFRSYNTSHLRFSYNYDFFMEAGDFMAVIATPGAGYFTDTKNKGWFLHGSFGLILPFGEFFTFSPYFRYRHTFINDDLKSDINDISLGVSIMVYF